MKHLIVLVAMLVSAQSHSLVQICAKEESMKQVELVPGTKDNPCLVTYEGEVKWSFSHDFRQCGEKMDLLVMKLENAGYWCFSSDSEKI